MKSQNISFFTVTVSYECWINLMNPNFDFFSVENNHISKMEDFNEITFQQQDDPNKRFPTYFSNISDGEQQ